MSTGSEVRALVIGQGPTTASALEGLRKDSIVVSGLIRSLDDLADSAREIGIEVIADTSIAALRSAVDRLQPDVVIVSSYDRVLPEDLVDRVPFVNVHYGKLPQMRGRAVVNWSVILGHASTAITIHSLTSGLDSGGILYQEEVPINPNDTVTSLYDRLNDIQRREIASAARRRAAGEPGAHQVGEPTYASTRVPADGRIDWNDSAIEIERLVRGLGGMYPNAFTYLGLRRIEVVEAYAEPFQEKWVGWIPGRIHSVDRGRGDARVFTGSGLLRLVWVRHADSVPARAATVVTSTRQTLGLDVDALVDRVMRLESALASLAANRL